MFGCGREAALGGNTLPPSDSRRLKPAARVFRRFAHGDSATKAPPHMMLRVWVTRDESRDGPLSIALRKAGVAPVWEPVLERHVVDDAGKEIARSEEHTSELQSH